jgi:hypothetical protein
MATLASEVMDLFMSSISDWRLDSLIATSGSPALITYLEPLLLKSIDEFKRVCNQTLTYSKVTQSFSLDLNQQNINVLSQLMEKFWQRKNISDIRQMNLSIKDREFDHYAEGQNLKEKRALYNETKEEISQILLDYSLTYNDWTAWGNQDFDGS